MAHSSAFKTNRSDDLRIIAKFVFFQFFKKNKKTPVDISR